MTESEYEAALVECDRLCGLDPDPESPEGQRLAELSAQLEEFERTRWPVERIGTAHADEEEAEGPSMIDQGIPIAGARYFDDTPGNDEGPPAEGEAEDPRGV